MVTRQGGSRRKTRHTFKKHFRKAGKISIRDHLQVFEKGDQVTLLAEPAMQNGMYNRRFHGRVGHVKRKIGACFEVILGEGKGKKYVTVHPLHLRRM